MARREEYPQLPSTQDRAIELAREGAEEGSAVVARTQSRGRGRGDRLWVSPAGGLYLSVILRPTTVAPLLSLAVGAEVAEAISLEYGVRVRLKWPNDLLAVDGAGSARKLAGILVDLVPTRDGGTAAVVGIGVNAGPLDAAAPAEVRERSVSLEELTGRPVDLGRLEAVVARAAVSARRALAEPTGSAPVVARVRGLLWGVGDEVTVDGSPAGVLRGVRDDGALEVGTAAGPRAVLVGDVRVEAVR